jgi:hypothetical protein
MTNLSTVCGHDRETLRRAIMLHELRERDDGAGFMLLSHGTGQQTVDAYDDIRDPAKLAAIIAELVNVHGIEAKSCVDGEQSGALISIVACSKTQTLSVWVDFDMNPIVVAMPQARAFALRLLDAPTATAQDIERMIGEL